MEWKNSVEASKMPILFLAILVVIRTAVVFAVSGLLFLFAILAMFLIAALIYLWAGYNAVKKFKLDTKETALAGAITGLISGLIDGAVSFAVLQYALSTGAQSTLAQRAGVSPYVLLMMSVLLGTIFWIAAGAVLAAVGGYIAMRGKPKEKPAAKRPSKRK